MADLVDVPDSISMNEIFRVAESLMGKRADAWLDRHSPQLKAVPSQLMMTAEGRKILYRHLMEIKRAASQMARENAPPQRR
jgi:hypothetical protein